MENYTHVDGIYTANPSVVAEARKIVTATYGQGNDYFMQPSLRSIGFNVKVKL